jgi:hypothetical protein
MTGGAARYVTQHNTDDGSRPPQSAPYRWPVSRAQARRLPASGYLASRPSSATTVNSLPCTTATRTSCPSPAWRPGSRPTRCTWTSSLASTTCWTRPPGGVRRARRTGRPGRRLRRRPCRGGQRPIRDEQAARRPPHLGGADRAASLRVGDASRGEQQARSQDSQATPWPSATFLVQWIITHASPGQRKALFKSTPALPLVYWLSLRHYRRIDQALVRSAGQSQLA